MRIAVLGCGSIGRRHLRNLASLGERDLVAFDPSAEARAAASRETAARYESSLDSVWEAQPEVVLVTSPPGMHVDLARAAVERGCHLFVEKPLSNSDDGVEDLVAAAARQGVVTMVGCNMRFHPGPARVRSLLEQCSIGDILSARIETGSYLPGWRPGTDYRRGYSASAADGGGAILDCIHELDLALWYCGPGVVVACATVPATSIGLDVEGAAEVLVRHDSGALSSVHLSFIQRDYHRGCSIVGSEGTISWNFGTGLVRLYREADGWRSFEPPDGWELNRMFVDELEHFLSCVATGEQSSCPLEQGWSALRLALAARQRASASAMEMA